MSTEIPDRLAEQIACERCGKPTLLRPGECADEHKRVIEMQAHL